MLDLHNNMKATVALAPQTQTNADTAIVGEIIDMAGFDTCELVILTGTLTDANATFALTLEHGDDSALSDTAVPAAGDLIGTIAATAFTFAADKATRKIGYRGTKRYLRATITPTGNNSGAAPVAMLAIQTVARVKPVA
jgi:hypothetical protein